MLYRLRLITAMFVTGLLAACGGGEDVMENGGVSSETELACESRRMYYLAEENERIRLDAMNCLFFIYNQPRRIRLYGSDTTLYTEPDIDVDDRGDGNVIIQNL